MKNHHQFTHTTRHHNHNHALQVWATFVRICHKLKLNPYKWDTDSQSFHLSQRRSKFYLNAFVSQFILILAYESFLLLRGFQEVVYSHDPLVRKTELLFYIEAYVLLNVNEWMIIWNYELYPAFIRNFFRQLTKYEQSPHSANAEDRKLTIFLTVIAMNCVIPAFKRAQRVFKDPQFPALLSSLLDNPQMMPMSLKLCFGLLHLQMNAFHYFTFAFNMMAILFYNVGLVNMIESLSADDGKYVRNWRLLQTRYRELSILQGMFNEMFYNFNFVGEVIAISSCIMNLFLGVIFDSGKGAIVGILSLAITHIMFSNLARIHITSDQVILSWARQSPPPSFRLFQRSCRPLRVRIGRYYHADKQLVLTIFSIVTVNTANLIMTFRLDSK